MMTANAVVGPLEAVLAMVRVAVGGAMCDAEVVVPGSDGIQMETDNVTGTHGFGASAVGEKITPP